MFNNSQSLIASLFLVTILVTYSCKPKEDVVLKQVRDIVLDASPDPMLHANAVLYNPNIMKMNLRKFDVEIFVNGKNAAHIDQEMQFTVPSSAEFTVPLEARLNLKELGLLDTIFGMLGGKKMKVEYKGSISITYKGVPLKVPVSYQSEIRVKL